MLGHDSALATICILAICFGHVVGGSEKGFLAAERAHQDKLWNAFQESEMQLEHGASQGNSQVEKAQDEEVSLRSRSLQKDRNDEPDGFQDRVWRRLLRRFQIGKAWVAKPAAAPGAPVSVNYSMQLMPVGPDVQSPCEERVQECEFQSMSCERILSKVRVQIVDLNTRLYHTANGHPLLNTLAIRSDVHHRKSPFQEGVPPEGLKHFVKETQKMKRTAAPGGLMPSNDYLTDEALVNATMQQVGHIDWIARLQHAVKTFDKASNKTERRKSAPIKVPSGSPCLKKAGPGLGSNVMAPAIAENIASVLPNNLTNTLTDNFNQTCTGIQTAAFNDCRSFVEACKDQVDDKETTMRRLRRELHKRLEEFKRY